MSKSHPSQTYDDPEWIPKKVEERCPGIPVVFKITKTDDMLFLDNGKEYMKYPNDIAGWTMMCEGLMDLEP